MDQREQKLVPIAADDQDLRCGCIMINPERSRRKKHAVQVTKGSRPRRIPAACTCSITCLGPTHADGRTWLRSSKAPLYAQYHIQLCLHVLERDLRQRLRRTAGPPLRLRQAPNERLSTPSQSKLTRLRTCKRSPSCTRFALPNQDSNAKPGAHHVVPFVSDKYSPDLGPKFLRGVKRIEKRVCLCRGSRS